jgi:hypothetical protein
MGVRGSERGVGKGWDDGNLQKGNPTSGTSYPILYL